MLKKLLFNEKSIEADLFELKVAEFQFAMHRYNNNIFYKKISIVASIIIISLQIISAKQFYQFCHLINPMSLIFPFICAYILTDFINGLIHMYMDNNTQYCSIVGPFIAAFHLHHLSPKYTDKHPLKIYFYESGTKFWLVIYLSLLVLIQQSLTLSNGINFCLVCIGILSSLAEVSHFWCHRSKNRNICITFLQKNGILLSKKHHLIHHYSDNKNYAFLNGISDPLINLISHYFYTGYKNNSDQHAKAYTGLQTDNRR